VIAGSSQAEAQGIDLAENGDGRMIVSMGPQHPSTHGVLQVITELEGEIVMRADPEIGYLHTGIEKSAENLFWTQASTVIERMDYLSPLSNAACYVMGVEKLLGITDDVPERAQHARVMLCELHRIASHCVWLGTGGIDLGAISGFFYAFDLRERILDLTELSGGARMHPNYLRIGGLRDDLPAGFLGKVDELVAMYYPRMRELRNLLQKNPILQDRMIDVGIVNAEDALAWGLTGPPLRATGIPYDVRRAFPYSSYEKYEFDVVTRTEGDAYARFMVRLDEMDQSMRIVEQARKFLNTPGPVMIADTKYAAPPKETIALSMEALIHHFKIVSESFRVPPGDVYQAIEGPRGELGYYIVSNGDNRPWGGGGGPPPPATPGGGAGPRARPRCTTCKCSRRLPSASTSPIWSS
jgi:NADH-quinone oxidoreductase subunit D